MTKMKKALTCQIDGSELPWQISALRHQLKIISQ
jgi:hypothetical protein